MTSLESLNGLPHVTGNSEIRQYPRGIVARIELSKTQTDFLSMGRRDIDWVMLNLSDAERLIRRGVTAMDFVPGLRVMTTSTIHDSQLVHFTVEREIEVVRAFKPEYHVPCDRPVYFEDYQRSREWFIEKSVEGTLRMSAELKGEGIRLIPLIKGTNEQEFLRSFEPLRAAGYRYFALYVKQYLGSGNGRRISQMIQYIRNVLSVCHVDGLMLIGYQSFNAIHNLPPQVKAFAGQRWRREASVGNLPPERCAARLLEWSNTFNKKGIARQELLANFGTQHPGGGG